ncbi:MAG: TPM domain-containing protein [bacterium]|nr:TPM domain-containing protein [bacterium]
MRIEKAARKKELVLCVLLVLVSLVVFLQAGAFCVRAEEREAHLYDNAGLFSQSERDDLKRAMQDAVKKTAMDFVVVTTEDAQGKTAERYGEDFYIDGDFGLDEEYSGMIFLIDMDNREIFYSPVGRMNYYVTDTRRDQILDDAFSYVVDGAYADAALLAVNDTVSYVVEAGVDTDVYVEMKPVQQKKSLTSVEIAAACGAAFLLAFLPCVSIAGGYRRKPGKSAATGFQSGYRTQSHFLLRKETDILVGKDVTSVRIPKNPPPSRSSGGRSSSSSRSSGSYRGSNSHRSSGRSFNGGSRKF